MAGGRVGLLTLVSLLVCSEVLCHFHFHGSNIKHGGPRVKRDTTCDSNEKYRSYDGSCHNLQKPDYGAAGETFRRLLPAQYEDGLATPTLTGVNNQSLPSPRTVSVIVHDPLNKTSSRINHMIMQWGQFLDHDITLTPTDTPSVECCYDALLSGDDLHPDVESGGACFPIIIAEGDSYFNTDESRCMYFERSAFVTDGDGVRQQYNAQTAWIDGSHIYGTSATEATELRELTDGKLKVKAVGGQDFLPENTHASSDDCFLVETDDYCFLAGDARVMAYPGLNAMHTIFLRYHNLMCDRLKAIHSDWNDETLYQEARRIVIAVLQRITYDEFLDELLGSTNAAKYELTSDSTSFSYNSSIDPTLPNVFSTAAYRFGHSMVSDSLTFNGTIVETGELFNRPKYVLNSLKNVVEAILSELSQRTDRWYTAGMTNKMFEKPGEPRSGYDIAARNIQRGRDHGLPSYNAWRQTCGLTTFSDFDELPTAIGKFRQTYDSVEDIDLYSGGVNEPSETTDELVGPLYVCLLGQVFHDLKFADRFWYENTGDSVVSFTAEQVAEIQKVRLSRVLCDTVDGMEEVQRNAFKIVNNRNTLTSCDSITDLDISLF